MTLRPALLATLMLAAMALSGCAVAIGGMAAIGADAIVENQQGGDGLF